MVVEPVNLEKIESDLLPDLNDLRNIGSAAKQWRRIFVGIIVVASMTIGNIALTDEGGVFTINASVNISGDLDVQKLNATSGFIGTETIATLADLTGGNVTVASIIRIQNKVGSTVEPLKLMFFSGFNVGQNAPEAQFALSTDEEKHAECITSETIPNNAFGQCVVTGIINDVDTNQYTALAELHLNETDGTMVEEEPTKVACLQEVGLILRSHATKGVAFVHIVSGCQEVPNFVNVTGNMTQGTNVFHFFGDDENASINYNGSMLRIKVK